MIRSFKPLANKVFLKLYFSQTISLLGDAFTWVGIALLAYQFGGAKSSAILATALTLRVTAFIIFGPFAGVNTAKSMEPISPGHICGGPLLTQ
jgi:MFS transporter, NRE family, putaive nickel resistance protein